MREILFRGKNYKGEWINGSLQQWYDDFNGEIKSQIHAVKLEPSQQGGRVDSKTVGQFTGLTDKNGEPIFEGDIISTDLKRSYLIVEFKGGAFVFNCNDGGEDYYDHINNSSELINEYRYGEIIGNIHDNPELLT